MGLASFNKARRQQKEKLENEVIEVEVKVPEKKKAGAK